MTNLAPLDTWLDALQAALRGGAFVKAVLAQPAESAAPEGLRVEVRAVALRGAPRLSFVHHHATRDITRNFAPDEAIDELRRLAKAAFRHAHLLTVDEAIEWRVSRRGKEVVLRGRRDRSVEAQSAEGSIHASAAPEDGTAPLNPAVHDRVKRRPVDVARPFLVELGVTDAAHRVIPAMARKWKQINKFVEVLGHAIDQAPFADAKRIRVADFGSGRGYLTFALHDHLTRQRGAHAEVTGIELRADLVDFCNGVVGRLALQGLRFQQGDLATIQPPALDVVVALHACDTATDHAIHLAIEAGAAVIVCSPCCHKEIRPQMAKPGVLAPLLEHGIHFAQEAEMVTDTLRALLLEANGYAAQVFEFVSLEHTSKNKMILAVRRDAGGHHDRALAQIATIKQFYGIREQRLERLLAQASGASSSTGRILNMPQPSIDITTSRS